MFVREQTLPDSVLVCRIENDCVSGHLRGCCTLGACVAVCGVVLTPHGGDDESDEKGIDEPDEAVGKLGDVVVRVTFKDWEPPTHVPLKQRRSARDQHDQAGE